MKYLWKTKKEEINEEYIAEKRKEFAVEMSIWEHYCSGEFIAGDQFTMADVYFFPYLATVVRGGLMLDGRPNLKRYYEKLASRPSIQASWPPHYKTSPPSEIFVGV